MKLAIELELDGAAFFDNPPTGEPGSEIQACLTRVTDALVTRDALTDTGVIRDTNGNSCGSWRVIQ